MTEPTLSGLKSLDISPRQSAPSLIEASDIRHASSSFDENAATPTSRPSQPRVLPVVAPDTHGMSISSSSPPVSAAAEQQSIDSTKPSSLTKIKDALSPSVTKIANAAKNAAAVSGVVTGSVIGATAGVVGTVGAVALAPAALPVGAVYGTWKLVNKIIEKVKERGERKEKSKKIERLLTLLNGSTNFTYTIGLFLATGLITNTLNVSHDGTDIRTVKQYSDWLNDQLQSIDTMLNSPSVDTKVIIQNITTLNGFNTKVLEDIHEHIHKYFKNNNAELTQSLQAIKQFHKRMEDATTNKGTVLGLYRKIYRDEEWKQLSKIFDMYKHQAELKKYLQEPHVLDELYQKAVNVQTEWKNAFDMYTPKVAPIPRKGETAPAPPSLNVFKTIRYVASMPEPITESSLSAARVDYNEAVFREVASQISVAAALNGGGIPLEEFGYNKTIGDLLKHFDTVDEVAREYYHLEKDEDINRFVRFFEYMLLVLVDFYTWVDTNKDLPKKIVTRELFDQYVNSLKDKAKYYIDPALVLPDTKAAFRADAIKDYFKNTKDRVAREGLRMIEGIVPIDRIEHFRQLEEMTDDDRASMTNIRSELESDEREYERMTRDREAIGQKYTELMSLLPDAASREAAREYINNELKAREIKYKFAPVSGGKLTGGDPPKADKLLPMIRDMLGTIPPSADEAHVRENMKGTLLALIQGTGLEKKVADLASKTGSDVSSVILDGVKTGILASIAAASSPKAMAAAVAPENTPYQDAVAKAAVLSAIATMLREKDYKDSADKVEAASEQIIELQKKQTTNDPLLYNVALSAILASLKSATDKKDDKLQVALDAHMAAVEKRIDELSKPNVDNMMTQALMGIGLMKSMTNKDGTPIKPEDIPITREQLLMMMTQALLSIGALTKKEVAVVSTAPSDNVKEELVTAVLNRLTTREKSEVQDIISSKMAQITQEYERQKGELFLELNEAKANYNAASSSVDTLRAQMSTRLEALSKQIQEANKSAQRSDDAYKQLDEELRALKSRGATISPDLYTSLSKAQTDVQIANKNLVDLTGKYSSLSTRLGEIERLATNAEENAKTSVDKVTEAKEQMTQFSNEQKGLIEQLIKLLQERCDEAKATATPGAMDGGDGAADATKPQDPVAQAKQIRKELDDVKKALRGITDAFGGLKSKYERFHKTLPSEDERENFKNGKYGDSKRVLGVYSYLNEEGRKFVDELKNTISEKKKALVTAQEAVAKVYDTEPTNAIYIKDAGTLKTLIEGDYSAGTAGVLSIMDGIAGGIQTEYDENFSVLKAAAEGIKQEKEYAIREKQQQVAPMYGVPSSSSSSTAEAEKVRAALNNVKKAEDTAKALKLDIDKYLKQVETKIVEVKDAIDKARTDETLRKKLEAQREKLESTKESIDKQQTAARDKIDGYKSIIDAFAPSTTSGKDPVGAELAARYASDAAQIADDVKKLAGDAEEAAKAAAIPVAKPASAATSVDEDIKAKFVLIDKIVGTQILKDLVQKLDQIYLRKLNPALNSATSSEPTMLAMLWDNYLKKKDEKGAMVAAKELTEQMEANNLVPAKVLQVSMIDKSIFIFVTLVIRMISLSITSYIVMKGKLRTLPWALGAFLFIYALIYVAFVMFINLDMYRLRILFNFLNLHGNTPNIFLHLLLMWLFSFVIFMVMWNINFPLRGVKTTAISDEEKADLIYRLEVLTMIVWLFLVLMVVIAS